MQTALFHPRLFTAVVALEPLLTAGEGKNNFNGITALSMAKRRDRWTSRQDARIALLKTRYYAAFDPEVFNRVVEHDLRDVPVEGVFSQCPKSQNPPVTLTTPKAMEVATMIRSNPKDSSSDYNELVSDYDGNIDQFILPGFYRAEPTLIQQRLGSIKPQVLYVFATESPVDTKGSYLNYLVKHTGIKRGGNGGKTKNAVASVMVYGAFSYPLLLHQ